MAQQIFFSLAATVKGSLQCKIPSDAQLGRSKNNGESTAMHQYRIQLINPNTSREMTETMAKAARKVASPRVQIEAVCPCEGVPSIEGHFDEAVATLGILEHIRRGEDQGVDGHIIACFGDPGLLAARELASGPVMGIAEAAMHVATLVATRFSIVTTLPRTLIIARHLLAKYGFSEHCSAIHAIDLPVLALEDGSGQAQQKVREFCLKAKQHDNCGAIILGCGGMADLAHELSHDLQMPVIDGVGAAVSLMESLLQLGVTTSKWGDLNFPRNKGISGPFSKCLIKS